MKKLKNFILKIKCKYLAKKILIALLQNPERYKYIAIQVEIGKLKQEEANIKNINKAYKIAECFLKYNHKISNE